MATASNSRPHQIAGSARLSPIAIRIFCVPGAARFGALSCAPECTSHEFHPDLMQNPGRFRRSELEPDAVMELTLMGSDSMPDWRTTYEEE